MPTNPTHRAPIGTLAAVAAAAVLALAACRGADGGTARVPVEQTVPSASSSPSPSPSTSPSPAAAATTPAAPDAPRTTTTTRPPGPGGGNTTGTRTGGPGDGVYYRTCAEARAAGAAPLHRGEPGYRPALDRDGDGIACD